MAKYFITSVVHVSYFYTGYIRIQMVKQGEINSFTKAQHKVHKSPQNKV